LSEGWNGRGSPKCWPPRSPDTPPLEFHPWGQGSCWYRKWKWATIWSKVTDIGGTVVPGSLFDCCKICETNADRWTGLAVLSTDNTCNLSFVFNSSSYH
jgi:hypothetical protein